MVNRQQEEPTRCDGGRQPSMNGTSRVTGDCHARLCVQQRLARSVGQKPTEVRVRSLVAWIAGRKETEFLKPIDDVIRGMAASHWAVTKVNAKVASKVSSPRRPSPQLWGEGSMDRRSLTEAARHSGGVGATARWQGRAKQLEKPSSSRREIGGAGKPYNWSTQEIGGRREGVGGAHSSEEAG